jgi:vacuolar-type H+-ATPase subunit E/Vma4
MMSDEPSRAQLEWRIEELEGTNKILGQWVEDYKKRIAELEADHKKSELMWWDEKGVLEDRIAELEARHDNFLKEFWKTNADNERLRKRLDAIANAYAATADELRAAALWEEKDDD